MMDNKPRINKMKPWIASCYELVGSRQHGVAQQKVEQTNTRSVIYQMHVVMISNGPKFRVFYADGQRCSNLSPLLSQPRAVTSHCSRSLDVVIFGVLIKCRGDPRHLRIAFEWTKDVKIVILFEIAAKAVTSHCRGS